MTKRTTGKFERRKNDVYDTPPSAVQPLLPFLPPKTRFVEPCAGARVLADELERHGHVCLDAFDTNPRHPAVFAYHGAQQIEVISTFYADCFITNPPWTRSILHPIIDRLCQIRPTWLLFDSDWMFTKQARPYLAKCTTIVSVGRVSWMNNGVSGFDNCAWYRFANEPHRHGPPVFYNLSQEKV